MKIKAFKFAVIVLSVLMAVNSISFVASSVDSLAYFVEPFTHTLIVSGNGAMTDHAKYSDSAYYGDSSIQHILFLGDISHIGDYSFVNMSSLKTVQMPNTVRSIGKGAFYNCPKIKSITFTQDQLFSSQIFRTLRA